MDGVRDKVVEMLSRGYSQTVVAAAVGCQDAYISQLEHLSQLQIPKV